MQAASPAVCVSASCCQKTWGCPMSWREVVAAGGGAAFASVRHRSVRLFVLEEGKNVIRYNLKMQGI